MTPTKAKHDDQTALLLPSAILSSYRQVAQSLNLDPDQMLRQVKLSPRCLIDPTLPVPAERVTKLLELSASATGVYDFGLRLALARGTPDIGPLNLLLREEPDLRAALKSLQNYLHVHSRSIRISLEPWSGAPVLVCGLAPRVAPYSAPQSIEMIVFGVLQTLRWLVGERWSPQLACLSHSAPANARRHPQAFGCAVEFAHDFDGLVLTEADLDRRIANSNANARRHAETIVRQLAARSDTDLSTVVSGMMAGLLPSRSCSADRIANHLGVDRTTLHRRLAASGQSYSSLLQTTREALARRLVSTNTTLAHVADQLGFSSASVFARWFQKSFAMSASEWREAQAAKRRRAP